MTFNPNNPTASGMVLTFDDEFNGVSWSSDNIANKTLWTDHGINIDPSQTANLLSVSNGVLTSAVANTGSGWQYSGIQTVNSQDQGWTQKYGYFEADLKTAAGDGAWNSWWLLSANHFSNGSPASELDIMENWGSTPSTWGATIHDGNGNASPDFPSTGVDLSQGYHRYGMLWDPNSPNIIWYFDGKEVGTTPKMSTTDSSPMMMIIGQGMGSGNGQDASTPNPMNMQIDYVRAYQFASQNPTAVAPEPVSPAAGNNDPAAHVDALGNAADVLGASSGGSTATTSSEGSTPISTSGSGSSTASGSGPDTLTLHVSGDMYQGDPLVEVFVDGKQVGGTYDISAHHSQGQWQDITLNGNWDPGTAHQVQIQFVNDGWDGTGSTDGHDRNVYVGALTLDGHQVAGTSAASNTGAAGDASSDPHAAELYANGTVAYDLTATAPTSSDSASGSTAGSTGATPTGTSGQDGSTASGQSGSTASGHSGSTASGSGPNSLTLHVAGDMYHGDPQVEVFVDGKQVGGTYDISAHHSQGQWQDITLNGNWDAGTAHQVQIQFVNDGWDGTGSTDGHDRNVYVGALTLDGHQVAGTSVASNTGAAGVTSSDPNAAELYANGTATYHLPADPSAASGSSSGATASSGSTATTLTPSFVDNAGHDLFVLTSANSSANAHISNFDPGHDVLDLAPLLKAQGYTGTDPLADHVVSLQQSGTDSTAITIDPTGHDPSHGATVVTLDHVLPQNVAAANIWA